MITELKKYEEQIKTDKEAAKHLKTDFVFYHQLISLFCFHHQGETVSKEYLVLAMRILSRLISQVKLEGEAREDDITKKRDLVIAIVNMLQHLDDD